MCLGLLVHTDSRVAHFEQGEAAVLCACFGLCGIGVRSDAPGLDAQLAAVRHRVARVDHQVQDDLLDLTGICFDASEMVVQHYGEFDVFFDQATEHLFRVRYDLVDIQDDWFNNLLTTEHQELARERSSTVRRLLDLLDFRAIGINQCGIIQKQIAVPGNHREQIVEVMRHSTSQAANRLHLLGLLQNLFGFRNRRECLVCFLPAKPVQDAICTV